jgi:hypothetical protein
MNVRKCSGRQALKEVNMQKPTFECNGKRILKQNIMCYFIVLFILGFVQAVYLSPNEISFTKYPKTLTIHI